jgi:hypothetical protein
MPDRGRPTSRFTVIASGPERQPMTFRADTAVHAYEIALNKSVYASLQVKVTGETGQEISLEELHELAKLETKPTL